MTVLDDFSTFYLVRRGPQTIRSTLCKNVCTPPCFRQHLPLEAAGCPRPHGLTPHLMSRGCELSCIIETHHLLPGRNERFIGRMSPD